MLRTAALAIVLLAATVPAAANDSTAVLGAGGIELVINTDVHLIKENLHISMDKVTVDYIFQNLRDQPREYLVAFPMPDIVSAHYIEGSWGVEDWENDNFLNFQTTVDGKPVTTAVEVKALSLGLDVSAELTALGIPLNPLSDAARQKVAALAPETAQELIRRGIIQAHEDPGPYMPAWTKRTTYYWKQVFPAKTPVAISHTYKPANGSFFYSPGEDYNEPERKAYCIDKSTEAALLSKTKAAKTSYATARVVHYILQTANNWADPIDDFTLTIEKPSPDWIVSLCIPGIKKITRTTYQMKAERYEPDGDLRIVFLDVAAQTPE